MSDLLDIAIQASILAGAKILQIYDTDFLVSHKADDSPLTQADREANKIIINHISKTEFPIISEENKQIGFEERKRWETCWIVDPLDGTKEFIKRNGEFTVNIALVEKGVPKLGVIYVPVSRALYFTGYNDSASFKVVVRDENEKISSLIERATKITPSKNSSTVRIVGSRSHLNDETKAFVAEMAAKNTVEMVSIGSSLKFCLVAEGNAECYPRFAPTMEWDTAAGQAICEAVGISVIAIPSTEPLRYNKQNLLNPHFLVSNRL